MSRYYKVQLDLVGAVEADEEALEVVLEVAGVEVGTVSPTESGLVIDGNISLTAGESPWEAHKRLQQALGGRRLKSRWLSMEEQERDVVISDEPGGDGPEG